MPYHLICAECSEHFETNWPASKFCGDACRLKNWRDKRKSERKVFHSTCPNCWDAFTHKNPKKEFCTPKCKTAYHRKQANELEKRGKYFNSRNYFAPPTPDEQIHRMLENALIEQELEDI